MNVIKKILTLKNNNLSSAFIWNIVGQSSPLLIGLLTIPLLLSQLGAERFGLVAIAWSILGYTSVFDLGISKALVLFLSNKDTQKETGQVEVFIGTAYAVSLAMGIILAQSFGLMCTKIPEILNANIDLYSEVSRSCIIIALSAPVILLSNAARGLLEARLMFREVNYIRLFVGALNFLAPTLISLHWINLETIIASLLVIRVLEFILYQRIAWKEYRLLPDIRLLNKETLAKLLGFGGWITVSNIISPLMETLDRFIIASKLSLNEAAAYVVPSDLTQRLRVVPSSLASVMFVKLAGSAHYSESENTDLSKEFGFAYNAIIIIQCLITSLLLMFAEYLLKFWLGAQLDPKSIVVSQYLLIGSFINGVAVLPHTLIQSSGRSDITAFIHLFEFPIYLALLFILIDSFGIQGAAIAFLIRVALDALLLHGFCYKIQPFLRKMLIKKLLILISIALFQIIFVTLL